MALNTNWQESSSSRTVTGKVLGSWRSYGGGGRGGGGWKSYGGGGGGGMAVVQSWESSPLRSFSVGGRVGVMGVSWGGRRVSDIVLPRTLRFSLTLTYLCSHGKPPPSVLFRLSFPSISYWGLIL